jgi:predicted nucleic acid-binding protein
MSSLENSPTIVIDANIAVRCLLPIGEGLEVRCVQKWKRGGVTLAAPDLWLIEVTSAMRRAVSVGLISMDEALTSLDDISALDVQLLAIEISLCKSAFQWATRLNQSKAYDGLYLALAERLGEEFWTGDERLYHQARRLGCDWVHWIGEMSV